MWDCTVAENVLRHHKLRFFYLPPPVSLETAKNENDTLFSSSQWIAIGKIELVKVYDVIFGYFRTTVLSLRYLGMC